MFVNNKDLYLNKEGSDVTLVVEDIDLPAHRSILSKKSEYFKTMFSHNFAEAKSNKITLKEVNLNDFNFVLHFIYTGKTYHDLSMHDLGYKFRFLKCAQYFMVDELVSLLYDSIKDKYSPTKTLNYASIHSVNEFISYSSEAIQKRVPYFFESFDQLSPAALEHLLKLTLHVQEFKIFEALVKWMRANPAYSDTFSKLLELVDLYLLEEDNLTLLFTKPALIDQTYCQDLVNRQREQANNVQIVVDKNVVNNMNDIRIIEGRPNMPIECGNYVTFDLKQQFLLNCLKLNFNGDAWYTVSVSKDLRDWELIIDHSNYKCQRPQVVYFKESAFRFICVQAELFSFLLRPDIEAIYSSHPLKCDSDTLVSIPKRNLVPDFKCEIDKSEKSYGSFIKGSFVDGYMRHKIGDDGIIFSFHRPYMLGSIGFLLKEKSSFYIEIASNQDKWSRVYTVDNDFGKVIVPFSKNLVKLIKIVGTKTPSTYFYVSELECPACY